MANTQTVKRDTYKVDATDQALGRLASDIAQHLIGKHKVEFQSHLDVGDIVEVENVAKIKMTGNKFTKKEYHHHTGYPGGIKTKTMEEIYNQNPAKLLEMAVSRMLPKNKHRTERLKRLKIS